MENTTAVSKVDSFVLDSLQTFVSNATRIGKLGLSAGRFEESLRKNLDAGSPSGALLVIQENLEMLSELEKENHPAFTEIANLSHSLKLSATKHAELFPIKFPEAIELLGISFCEGTLNPLYILDRGFIEVRLNTRLLQVQISTRAGRGHIVGVETDIVVKEIRSILERLHNRNLNITELRQRIHDTYNELQRNESMLKSEHIKIRNFVKHYQKKYKCLADEAVMDLSVAYGNFEELKLDYTKEHEQGYLLYGFEDRGYYGFVRLER